MKKSPEEIGLKTIMSTKAGRAWMWSHLSSTGLFTTSFRTNALEMSFAEGTRNVGLRLLNDLEEYTPDEYQKMQLEARDLNEDKDDVDKTD